MFLVYAYGQNVSGRGQEVQLGAYEEEEMALAIALARRAEFDEVMVYDDEADRYLEF